MNNFGEEVSFIWSVADLLRGPNRPNQHKDAMLPVTVLPRLDGQARTLLTMLFDQISLLFA